jgi:iron complex transport system permease protein
MSMSATLERAEVSLEDARKQVSRARAGGRRRVIRVSIVLAGLTTLVFCISLSVGDFPIPLRQVVPAIFGFGDPAAHLIVQTLRLPRALTGLMVGLAFGCSGAIFQTLARNPLASPDILGVTQGASLAAVLIITAHVAATSLLPFAAFAGGIVTALLIYVLAYRRGVSSYRLVLVGIGVGEIASALTVYLLTKAQLNDAANATAWLAGSLNSRGWESVLPLALSLAILAPVALMLANALRVLGLGDDAAKGVGLGVERTRLSLLIVGVALAGAGVAAAGPVAFVAFVSAPIARRLIRGPGPAMIPSALAGALLVLAADLIGRRMFAPTEIPVGIITGIIGAPYLLWLLARSNRIGRGG